MLSSSRALLNWPLSGLCTSNARLHATPFRHHTGVKSILFNSIGFSQKRTFSTEESDLASLMTMIKPAPPMWEVAPPADPKKFLINGKVVVNKQTLNRPWFKKNPLIDEFSTGDEVEVKYITDESYVQTFRGFVISIRENQINSNFAVANPEMEISYKFFHYNPNIAYVRIIRRAKQVEFDQKYREYKKMEDKKARKLAKLRAMAIEQGLESKEDNPIKAMARDAAQRARDAGKKAIVSQGAVSVGKKKHIKKAEEKTATTTAAKVPPKGPPAGGKKK